MIRAALLALLALFVSTTNGAAQDGSDAQGDPGTGQVERQILVMLRMAAPHFRPGENYAGSYDVGAGHAARRRVAADLARKYGLKMLADWPMPSLGVECYVMEVQQGADTAQVAQTVSRDTRAEWVQPMALFRSLGHDDPLYEVQPAASEWHLAELHKVSTGRRIVVAEVDSGVEATHPDLAGQVQATENFVPGNAYSGEQHGTAVAGIVAGIADNHIGIAGVAPGARLMVLRACWQTGDTAACSSFTLARALQFALDRGVRVINLSVTGPPDRLLNELLDVAVGRGATIVVAADPEQAQGGFPASHPGVLAVATDDATDVPWLLAPGRDVPTTLPGARFGFVSGSSFAAAHVSGLVALMMQLSPGLTAAQAREALLTKTVHVDGAASTRQAGRIDTCAVFARLTGSCTCSCTSADGVSAYTPR